MSAFIRGGTVVNADRSFRADVVCDEGKIVDVGENLKAPAGAKVIDGGGQYVMPGGIDPHTHMELPFMGTVASEDFSVGHRRGARRRHDDDHRLRDPVAEGEPAGGVPQVARLGREIGGRLQLPRRGHLVGQDRARRHGHAGAQARRQQLQAFHGLQERDHGRRRSAGEQLQRARWSWARCRPCTRKTANWCSSCSGSCWPVGITGPEGHVLSRPPEVEGEAANRAISIADVLGTPLYIVHVSCKEALDAITRARTQGQPRLRRMPGRASADGRQRLLQQGLVVPPPVTS